MGKTKVSVMDDSIEEQLKPTKSKAKDELVEKLKVELGMEPAEESQETKVESQEEKVEKKTQKPGKSKKVRSKKYQEISAELDRSKTYPVSEAVELVKKLSFTKYTGTMEAHINTAQTGIRGLVSLPFAAGKELKIVEFDGEDEIVEQINKGKIDFDMIITTPAGMAKLSKVARILGPKGLMPNPKNGTIVAKENLKKAVESFQAGKTEYKTEPKAAVIHLSLGKLDQPTEELSQNIKVLLSTLGKSRVKKVAISPTMGPSVRLDLTSL